VARILGKKTDSLLKEHIVNLRENKITKRFIVIIIIISQDNIGIIGETDTRASYS
jgi:hypothetical protein